jgi:hypothetical protein
MLLSVLKFIAFIWLGVFVLLVAGLAMIAVRYAFDRVARAIRRLARRS